MQKGQLVVARDFRHEALTRKIVEISGDTVYLCTVEEFSKAQELGVEPVCVGFNKSYVESLES